MLEIISIADGLLTKWNEVFALMEDAGEGEGKRGL